MAVFLASPAPGMELQVYVRQLQCKPKGRHGDCGNVEKGVHTQPGDRNVRKEFPWQLASIG